MTGAPLLAEPEAEGGRLRKRVTSGAVGKELSAIEKAAPVSELRKARGLYEDDEPALATQATAIDIAKEVKLALLLPF